MKYIKGKIFLAEPRGFCAGVRKALETVEKTLAVTNGPLYVLHDIVHNDFVVEGLKKKGVRFREKLSEIPTGATVIFSAHGVSGEVERQASELGLKTIDATCPLVKKIHNKAVDFHRRGYFIFLIGHRNHPEIQGTLGRIGGGGEVIETVEDVNLVNPGNFTSGTACLSQTTFSADDTAEIVGRLKEFFPDIKGAGDICYATQHRQDAVKLMAAESDVIFIAGSRKSSNSNRLREVALCAGTKAFLVNSVADITAEMHHNALNIGISAGASAPEALVKELEMYFRNMGWGPVETVSA